MLPELWPNSKSYISQSGRPYGTPGRPFGRSSLQPTIETIGERASDVSEPIILLASVGVGLACLLCGWAFCRSPSLTGLTLTDEFLQHALHPWSPKVRLQIVLYPHNPWMTSIVGRHQ